jgi:hypothetical protein
MLPAVGMADGDMPPIRFPHLRRRLCLSCEALYLSLQYGPFISNGPLPTSRPPKLRSPGTWGCTISQMKAKAGHESNRINSLSARSPVVPEFYLEWGLYLCCLGESMEYIQNVYPLRLILRQKLEGTDWASTGPVSTAATTYIYMGSECAP